MPNIQKPSPPPGAVAQQGLMAINESLVKRIAVLQHWADAKGREWLKGLASAVYSVDSAGSAQETFDQAWFDDQPYSPIVKKEIAKTLIELTRPYPCVDTTVWQTIVEA